MRVWVVIVESNDSAAGVDSVWDSEGQAIVRAADINMSRWKTATVNECCINVVGGA